MPDPIDLARGTRNTRGLIKWQTFGQNNDVDTATDPEQIWDYSGAATWVSPTQARVHNIVSGHADDDGTPYATGNGAHYVWVYGISANGDMVKEVVKLNGVAAVATTFEYTCVNRLTAHREFGSSLAQNVGEITATAATDGTVTRSIAAGAGQSLAAVFQTPRGHTSWLTRCFASMQKKTGTSADIVLHVMNHRSYVWNTIMVRGLISDGSSYFDEVLQSPHTISELSYIKMEAEVSADNTDIAGGWALTMRNDNKPKTYFIGDIGNTSEDRRFIQDISG